MKDKERYKSIEIETSDYFQIAICDNQNPMVMCNIHFEHEKEAQREMANKIIKGLNYLETVTPVDG